MAKLSPALRKGLLASTAVASVLMGSEAARAACDPAAADNVTATCTGTTINQGTGAPGTSLDVNGYGNFLLNNLNVTIMPGARVAGFNAGIGANTATVANSGTVTGDSSGIYAANTVTVTNSGTIAGANLYGILAGTANVTNSGTITGGDYGIRASTANVINSGTITGADFAGIHVNNTATVTNSGFITGGDNGIRASTVDVTNSGIITGTDFYGIYAINTATVTNSGLITGGDYGIWASTANVTNSGTITGTGPYGIHVTDTATVTNSGAIIGGDFGISASTANVNNSGTVTGGTRGINALVTANVINSGLITGGNYGIVANTANVTNSGTITGGDYGIRADTANVTNSGTITGAAFSGVNTDNTATVTNSGSITGSDYGIRASTANVTNSGTITGGGRGISADTATVANSGNISGGFYGIYATTLTVTNSGTITGANLYGISASTANVTNSGTITGGSYGIIAGTADVTNSGTINGGNNSGIRATTANLANSGTITGSIDGVSLITTGNVINSGTIVGAGGTAIRFNAGGTAASDSLSILPGARFGGLVNFGGGADKVNFGPGSWILDTANFNAALSTITTSGNPYVVTPNKIIVADLSGFGTMNRAVMDITGWIASVLPDTPVFAPTQGGAANAFAAIESAAPRFDHAFGTVSEAMVVGAMAFAPTTPVFKGGAVTDRDGNSVWAKSFGGRREQTTDGSFIGSVTIGYGGAIGYDRQVTPDTRLGGFIGGSTNETRLDLNAGQINTDAVFGGLYARSFFGASFLDLALIGGKLDNTSARNIGGGLTFETARATYDGWFVNPSMTLGHRFAFNNGYTVTPALKVRYVTAQFGGYTETGSSANLTAGDRNMQAFEERAEVTLANTHAFNNGSRLGVRVTGGVLALQYTGDATVNIALVGQNFIAATPDKQTVFGLYGGAGLDWQLGRMALFATGEVTGMNDNATTFTGKGGVRVVW
ncbi:MAG: autotransporter outer membrane beta-barrel domain-containing protein [Afipia sp.]